MRPAASRPACASRQAASAVAARSCASRHAASAAVAFVRRVPAPPARSLPRRAPRRGRRRRRRTTRGATPRPLPRRARRRAPAALRARRQPVPRARASFACSAAAAAAASRRLVSVVSRRRSRGGDVGDGRRLRGGVPLAPRFRDLVRALAQPLHSRPGLVPVSSSLRAARCRRGARVWAASRSASARVASCAGLFRFDGLARAPLLESLGRVGAGLAQDLLALRLHLIGWPCAAPRPRP